ncbi:MAG TPA: dockerin type I domain-containing protein [Planctomycetota bacterium]|nr:dockerin type I domain-containing protein [Planctomycetota bacterium]
MARLTRLLVHCLVISVVASLGIAHAATLYVGPGETYATIQAGINAAANGNTVIVRDGIYSGIGNHDIDFKGKAVHLRSENGPRHCTVDAEGKASAPNRCFVFKSGEGRGSILNGFTIKNGFALGNGGGIYCWGSPTIINNIIIGNNAEGYGGGIYAAGAASIVNNIIAGNTAHCGGGVTLQGNESVTNNTIFGNSAEWGGGAISAHKNIGPVVKNSILWNNGASDAIFLEPYSPGPVISTNLTIQHSNVQGGRSNVHLGIRCVLTWGSGNIDTDPLFASSADGDYHLRSEHGRWSPLIGAWMIDDETSACIGGGDPMTDYSNQPQPSRRIEMGAYGNTAEASKSKWVIPGDADGNSQVDVLDLIFLRNRLGQTVDAADNWKADVNEDGRINILDLIFARNRLGTSRP